MARRYNQFMSFLEHWANHGVPQMLGTIIAFVAAGLGLSMFCTPDAYEESRTFDLVFNFASPFAWGTVYIVSALAVAIMVYSNPKTAQAPVIMLGMAFGLQGLLTIPQAVDGGLPSAVFMYIGMAWVCLATQLVCGVAKERSREKAPLHH